MAPTMAALYTLSEIDQVTKNTVKDGTVTMRPIIEPLSTISFFVTLELG